MPSPSASKTVVVSNPQGLHARPAYLLARAAEQFQSKVELIKDGERVDGDSDGTFDNVERVQIAIDNRMIADPAPHHQIGAQKRRKLFGRRLRVRAPSCRAGCVRRSSGN